MDLSKFIQEFIETLPMERRLFPELYADDLAKAIEATGITARPTAGA